VIEQVEEQMSRSFTIKRLVILGILVVLNLVLAGRLLIRSRDPGLQEQVGVSPVVVVPSTQHVSNASAVSAPERKSPFNTPVPTTPFKRIYSSDPKQFVASLRAIRCPEETIKDIMVAEVKSRFGLREEALRPKPGDHVPYGWPANTSEAKILKRRQEAAALAQEKASMLRDSLGYEVAVLTPLYAMRDSDISFEQKLATTAQDKRDAMRQVQDAYWMTAQTLQERTKGFWLPEDVAELERAKARRREAMDSISSQ